jgi:hypothetical protein
VNQAAKNDLMVQLLLSATGTDEAPGWLAKLGELRNQFMHRQPMAANPEAAALLFRTVATQRGLIPVIRLSRFGKGEDAAENEDPFVALLRFWFSLEALSRACIPHAPYLPIHPVFTSDSHPHK